MVAAKPTPRSNPTTDRSVHAVGVPRSVAVEHSPLPITISVKGLALPLPTLVAIQFMMPALDERDLTHANLAQLLFEFGCIVKARGWRRIAAIRINVDETRVRPDSQQRGPAHRDAARASERRRPRTRPSRCRAG